MKYFWSAYGLILLASLYMSSQNVRPFGYGFNHISSEYSAPRQFSSKRLASDLFAVLPEPYVVKRPNIRKA